MRYHIVKLHLICTCNWWTHILLETLRIYEQSCRKGGPVQWYDLYKSCNWWNSISFETLRICEQSYWEEGPGKWYMYDSYESSLYITQTYHIHHLNQSHNVTTHIETPFSLAFTLSWQMFPACLTTGNNYLILHSTNSRYLFSLLLGDHLSIEEKRCASQMTSSMWWKNNVIIMFDNKEWKKCKYWSFLDASFRPCVWLVLPLIVEDSMKLPYNCPHLWKFSLKIIYNYYIFLVSVFSSLD